MIQRKDGIRGEKGVMGRLCEDEDPRGWLRTERVGGSGCQELARGQNASNEAFSNIVFW